MFPIRHGPWFLKGRSISVQRHECILSYRRSLKAGASTGCGPGTIATLNRKPHRMKSLCKHTCEQTACHPS